MKKIVILSLFTIGFLIQIVASDCVVVKIGQSMTTYNIEDPDNSNNWGAKVKITETKTTLPSDSDLLKLGMSEEELLSFSENVNGVYSSRLEKLQNDFEQLKTQQKIEQKNELIKKNLIIVSLILIIILILIFWRLEINRLKIKFNH